MLGAVRLVQLYLRPYTTRISSTFLFQNFHFHFHFSCPGVSKPNQTNYKLHVWWHIYCVALAKGPSSRAQFSGLLDFLLELLDCLISSAAEHGRATRWVTILCVLKVPLKISRLLCVYWLYPCIDLLFVRRRDMLFVSVPFHEGSSNDTRKSNDFLKKLSHNCIETLTPSKGAWVPKPCQTQVPDLSDSLVCHASIVGIRSTFWRNPWGVVGYSGGTQRPSAC